MRIGVNQFVRRQTAESKYSHFEGSWDELVELVETNFYYCRKPGYRDGVILVLVPPGRFFSGVVEVTPDTQLRATFAARHEEERPFIQVEAVGAEKLPARAVEIVLYRRDVLLEEPGGASTGADWEIVSINARPTCESEPLTPVAMARNFFVLPGGTKAEYATEEFARSIIYWSKRAMRG